MTETPDAGPPSQAVTGFPAVIAMVDRFLSAPGSTTVEISTGRTKHDNRHCVIVSLCGTTTAMLPGEASLLADVMENAMHAFPDDPNAQTLPNMIMGLRFAVDRLKARSGTPA